MPFPKGFRWPERKVPCHGCGIELKRRTQWKLARCLSCQEKERRKRQKGRWAKLHEQGRRYRIIMHRCGYPITIEGFKEFLGDLKDHPLEYRSKPEGRNACIDAAWEKKRSRREINVS